MTVGREAVGAELTAEINGSLARRHSTATVLFHHALADRLGLGPTDHKCLDLLHERAPMTASELAAITGLTSGAITGVVARLDGWAAGGVRRPPAGRDRRVPDRAIDLAYRRGALLRAQVLSAGGRQPGLARPVPATAEVS